MSDKDKIILEKIVKYCSDIIRYVGDSQKKDFINDDKTLAACAFCLGQIGELVKKLDSETKSEYLQIPWHKIYGLRNRIFHDYEGVDFSLLWEIVKYDIPKLYNDLHDNKNTVDNKNLSAIL